MKNLVVLTAVALLATACSDHEELPYKTSDANTILFGTTVQVETKAVVKGKNIPDGEQVGIYALTDASSPTWAAADGNLMDNVPATSDGAGSLEYSPLVKYTANNLHNFYAYYPHTEIVTDGDGLIAPVASGAPKLQVTLEKTPDKQLDYMYATPILNYKREADVDAIVPQKLVFNHALTQIRFRFKNTETTNSVSLVNIQVTDNDKGTMDITDGSWSGLSKTSGEDVFTFYRPASNLAVSAGTIVDLPDQLMLFPKGSMSDNTNLTIEVNLVDNNSAAKKITITPKVPGDGLVAGKSYLYTLLYSESEKDFISLSAEVVDWVDAVGGDLPVKPEGD